MKISDDLKNIQILKEMIFIIDFFSMDRDDDPCKLFVG
jgi:hypothetical protein